MFFTSVSNIYSLEESVQWLSMLEASVHIKLFTRIFVTLLLDLETLPKVSKKCKGVRQGRLIGLIVF